MLSLLTFSTNLATIGKYLGVHNIIFWKDPVNAAELMRRIGNKLAGWKKNTLSRAGTTMPITASDSGFNQLSDAIPICCLSRSNLIDTQTAV